MYSPETDIINSYNAILIDEVSMAKESIIDGIE